MGEPRAHLSRDLLVLLLLLGRERGGVGGAFVIAGTSAFAVCGPRHHGQPREGTALNQCNGSRRAGGSDGIGIAPHDGSHRRTKSRRRVRKLEDVLALGRDEAGIRRHARPEFQVLVVDSDHRRVGHDALVGGGSESDLIDLAAELAPGKRIHGELNGLPFGESTHVGLGNRGLDPHLREIVGDLQERRGVHARRDGLPDLDLARDHDAVHRGKNGGAREVNLGSFHPGLAGLHHGLGLGQAHPLAVELRLRNQILRQHLLGAVELKQGEFLGSLRVREIGFRLAEGALVGGRIDLHQQLAFLHLRIVIHLDVRDHPGDLASHIHHPHRRQRPVRRHRLHDVPFRDLGGLVLNLRHRGLLPISVAAVAPATQHSENEQPAQRRFSVGLAHVGFFDLK